MKKNTILIVLILSLLMNWNYLNAQTFTCTIQNQTVVGDQFKFDIYIQTTSGTLFLGNCDFVVTFNNANFTSPSVSRSLNPIFFAGAGDGIVYSSAISIVSNNRIILNLGAPFWDDQSLFNLYVVQPSGTAPGTRIATITVNGLTNPSGTANIQWRTVSPNNTVISNTGNSSPWIITNISASGTYTNPQDLPLPVEISSFTASSNQNAVNLKWQTATEVNNYGFEVERSVIANEERNLSWQKVGFVNGNGNSNSPKTYSFSDNNPSGGSKFLYRLKQIDNDGQFEYTDAVEVTINPMEYNLYQNYPNPFNPTTKIKFALPEAGKVVLKIYDMTGAEVAELVNADYEAGYYDIELNASNLASGVYIYRLQSSNFTAVKKLVVLK